MVVRYFGVVMLLCVACSCAVAQTSWPVTISPGDVSSAIPGITVENTSQGINPPKIMIYKDGSEYRVAMPAGSKAKVTLNGGDPDENPPGGEIPDDVELELDMEGNSTNPTSAEVTGSGTQEDGSRTPIEVDGASGKSDSTVDARGATSVEWSGDHAQVRTGTNSVIQF